MTLRSLVPALGALALVAPITAADTAGVKLSGWADNILVAGDDTADDVTAGSPSTTFPLGTQPKESNGGLGFSATGSIKAVWTVTDKLTAKINLWFSPNSAPVTMRESYFTYALGDGFSWSMGKYIDHMGWLSAEPTGLYTINGTFIGYTAPYGNDVIGTSLAYAPKEGIVSGSVHVVNGYYSSLDAVNRSYNGGAGRGRGNSDLGYGVDLVVTPNEMITFNPELAYDTSTEARDTAGDLTGGKGGSAYTFGLNGTFKKDIITVGAEFMYMSKGKDKDATGAKIDNDYKRVQGLLLANVALGKEPFPMSGTVMFQGVQTTTKNAADKDKTVLGQATVALMTNPLKDSNFGLNLEATYFSGRTDVDGATVTSGTVFSLEGIAVF